ncbi:hypothetical protein ACSSS7_000981 [Eimeria intestinalis]
MAGTLVLLPLLQSGSRHERTRSSKRAGDEEGECSRGSDDSDERPREEKRKCRDSSVERGERQPQEYVHSRHHGPHQSHSRPAAPGRQHG